MKRENLYVILCVITMLMLSAPSFAERVILYDTDLREVTGQAGFAKGSIIEINTHIDKIPVMNGILTLGDVTLQGSLTTMDSPAEIDPVDHITDIDLPEYGITGLGLSILRSIGFGSGQIDVTITMDLISIGAVYAGDDINGPSFGSVGVSGLSTDIRGTASFMPR